MANEKETSKKVEGKVEKVKTEKKITVRGLVENYIMNKFRKPEDVVKYVLDKYKEKNITTFAGNGNEVTEAKLKSEAKAVLTWMKNGLYKTLKETHNFEVEEDKVRLVPKN